MPGIFPIRMTPATINHTQWSWQSNTFLFPINLASSLNLVNCRDCLDGQSAVRDRSLYSVMLFVQTKQIVNF